MKDLTQEFPNKFSKNIPMEFNLKKINDEASNGISEKILPEKIKMNNCKNVLRIRRGIYSKIHKERNLLKNFQWNFYNYQKKHPNEIKR